MTIQEINTLNRSGLAKELSKCCGSTAWVSKMLPVFPVEDLNDLVENAEKQWYKCSEEDWKEAFAHHQRIGGIRSLSKGLPPEKKKFASTAEWAVGEQSGVASAEGRTLDAIAEGNRLYEEKFGYIFIICASGLSAEEMLDNLEARLLNTDDEEILIAAGEQNKITQLRIEKLIT